jgi:hypothetical protein
MYGRYCGLHALQDPFRPATISNVRFMLSSPVLEAALPTEPCPSYAAGLTSSHEADVRQSTAAGPPLQGRRCGHGACLDRPSGSDSRLACCVIATSSHLHSFGFMCCVTRSRWRHGASSARPWRQQARAAPLLVPVHLCARRLCQPYADVFKLLHCAFYDPPDNRLQRDAVSATRLQKTIRMCRASAFKVLSGHCAAGTPSSVSVACSASCVTCAAAARPPMPRCLPSSHPLRRPARPTPGPRPFKAPRRPPPASSSAQLPLPPSLPTSPQQLPSPTPSCHSRCGAVDPVLPCLPQLVVSCCYLTKAAACMLCFSH